MAASKSVLGIIVLFLYLGAAAAQACTLWAVSGGRVAGGGALIAKNRDWRPDHQQELRLDRFQGGWRFLGIYAVNGRSPGYKAGINEKGLVMLSASASCLPWSDRDNPEGTRRLKQTILSSCATVSEVLQKQELFNWPGFYLLADRRQLATLEVAPHNQRLIKIQDHGIICHTNHYLEPRLLPFNKRPKRSSLVRLDRVRQLLNHSSQPLTLTDFVSISRDRHAGPNNSLWRTGARPGKIRTLATWIVHLPPQGAPVLEVTLVNPHKPPETLRLTLDEAFWLKAQGGLPRSILSCQPQDRITHDVGQSH